jgi:hypothetical protein
VSAKYYYQSVISYLMDCPSKCSYTSGIVEHLGKDYEWTNSLLAEMREKELIFYSSGWGWRLRKGVTPESVV